MRGSHCQCSFLALTAVARLENQIFFAAAWDAIVSEKPRSARCGVDQNKISVPTSLIMHAPKSLDIKDVSSHRRGNLTNQRRFGGMRICPQQRNSRHSATQEILRSTFSNPKPIGVVACF